jgi:hypothetical protein
VSNSERRRVLSLDEATRTRVARGRALPPRPANTGMHPLKRTRSKAEDRAVERLRRICLGLPGVTEKIAWGELTWRVGKIFAQMDTHHHGAGHVAVWLAVPPGLQEALVDEDPALFFRPPYVGHKGWVGVRIDGRPDWKVVEGVVRDAHRFVAPSSSPLRSPGSRRVPAEER